MPGGSFLWYAPHLWYAPQDRPRRGAGGRVIRILDLIVDRNDLVLGNLDRTGVAAIGDWRVVGQDDLLRLVPGATVRADHGMYSPGRIAFAEHHQDPAVPELDEIGRMFPVGGDLDRAGPCTALIG